MKVAIGVLLGSSILAALVSQPSAEFFATVAYLAAIAAAIVLAVKRVRPDFRLIRTPERVAASPTESALRTFGGVAIVAMVGAALVSQPSSELLAVVAYLALIGMAIAIAVRCLSTESERR